MSQPQDHQKALSTIRKETTDHYKRQLYVALMNLPVEVATEKDAELIYDLASDPAIQQVLGGE